jgi:hypothetical protein
MFAGEPMGELVRGDDQKDHDDNQRERRQGIELANAVDDFGPICRHDPDRQENHHRREDQEVRRETETDFPLEPVQDPVGVEQLESKKQQVPADAPFALLLLSAAGFQQPGFLQFTDKRG